MGLVTKRKGKGKRGDGAGSFMDTYRSIRKPMPPPEQVLADKRRRMKDEDARREIEEADERADRRDD